MPVTFPLAILAASLAAPQPVASERQEDSFVVTVAARADKCSLALATKVDVRTIAGHPDEWTGKCVAIEGYWQSRALFAGRRDARKRYAQSNKVLRDRRVGIYGADELLSAAPRTPVPYTAVGIVGQCDELWAGAAMVMGYCHYTSGAYLAVAEMRRR